MAALADDLDTNPDTPVSTEGISLSTIATLAGVTLTPFSIVTLTIGAIIKFASWVYKFYQHTINNMACLMGYIVDITIVLNRLSATNHCKEDVLEVLQSYATSWEFTEVHNDIRQFVSSKSFLIPGQDRAIEEITRLIDKHCYGK